MLRRRALALALVLLSLPHARSVAAADDAAVPDPLAAWHDALASATVGEDVADILFVGDSITHGIPTPARDEWWVELVRQQLQGGDAGVGFVPAAYPAFAPSWTTHGGEISIDSGLGLRSLVLDGGATAELTITGTSVAVHYSTAPDGEPLAVTIDGRDAPAVDTTGPANGSGMWRSAPPGAGTHVVRVAVAGGAAGVAELQGAMVYDGDEVAGVHTWESGHAGFTASSFDGAAGFASSVHLADPELVLLELGTNDMALGVAPSTFEAQLTRIVDTVLAASDGTPSIALLPMWRSQSRDAAVHAAFVAAQARVAAARNLAVIDLSTLDASLIAADDVHPDALGQRLIADRVLAAIDPAHTPSTPTAAPTDVEATTGSDGSSILVRWTSGASGGTMIRAYDASTSARTIRTLTAAAGSTQVAFEGLAVGRTYEFDVIALGEAAYSSASRSNPVHIGPPSAPVSVTATAVARGATVSWTPPAGPVSGYLVQTFRMDGAGAYIGQLTVAGSATSAEVPALVPGGRYAFLVYARSNAGYSAPVATTTITIPTPPAPPTTVFAAALSGTSSGKVRLAWTAPSGATEYLVQVFDVTGPGAFVRQLEVDRTSAVIAGLTADHRYAFAVYARSAGGYSAPAASNTVTARA